MASLLFFLFLSNAVPATRTDLLVLIPSAAAVSFVAAGLGYWAMRHLRAQQARADGLADHLHHLREESVRRLNFLNAISHDLRTPLNGITLQTHVMEHALQARDSTTLNRSVAEIRTASGVAAKILDALLQYARVDVDRTSRGPVKLRDILTQTAEPFRAAAEDKALAFRLAFESDIEITTDRDKLQRILVNLLDNAVKFTAHGSITVRVRKAASAVETLPQAFHLESGHLPRAVTVEVSDTGAGIAPENCERVFREFFQANNPGRDPRMGLGLGLVIAQKLAQQIGGEIKCHSELRKGSTFTILLPERLPESELAA